MENASRSSPRTVNMEEFRTPKFAESFRLSIEERGVRREFVLRITPQFGAYRYTLAEMDPSGKELNRSTPFIVEADGDLKRKMESGLLKRIEQLAHIAKMNERLQNPTAYDKLKELLRGWKKSWLRRDPVKEQERLRRRRVNDL